MRDTLKPLPPIIYTQFICAQNFILFKDWNFVFLVNRRVESQGENHSAIYFIWNILAEYL
jgi:hypothetical protein